MTTLSPALETELREKVAEHGAANIVEVVVERAEPCYAVVATEPDDYATVGTTRFGGEPDLPPDWAWPCDGDPDSPLARFSTFVAQINFTELAPLGTPSGLPSSGLLSLFVGEMERTNVLVRVDAEYFAGDLSTLRRTATPDLMVRANLLDLKPWKVAAVPAVSVPQGPKSYRALFHDLPVSQAKPNSPDWHLYDLESALRREGQIGQLLGVANAGDMRVDLYRHIHLMHTGRLEWIFKNYWDSMEEYEAAIEKWRDKGGGIAEGYERMRGDVKDMLASNDEIARGAAEWQLFLQIDSNEHMGLEIKAGDPLYIFIRKDDLARGDFSHMVGKIMNEGTTWLRE